MHLSRQIMTATAVVAAGETVCGSDATTTTTSATTTTAAGGTAPCTASAIVAALGDDPSTTLSTYVCSEGWAAGTVSGGDTFILRDESGTWAEPSQDPCGSASAGLPAVILEDGCSS